MSTGDVNRCDRSHSNRFGRFAEGRRDRIAHVSPGAIAPQTGSLHLSLPYYRFVPANERRITPGAWGNAKRLTNRWPQPYFAIADLNGSPLVKTLGKRRWVVWATTPRKILTQMPPTPQLGAYRSLARTAERRKGQKNNERQRSHGERSHWY